MTVSVAHEHGIGAGLHQGEARGLHWNDVHAEHLFRSITRDDARDCTLCTASSS
ncbi:hypothetical protein ABZ725_51275 [Streptomyces sp. NPDC006872]|uniref:hypothetical protein n=1 Tax=Streptomyces sp. NPDC006872 TaxID=3155720 RepID=UPI0034101B6C